MAYLDLRGSHYTLPNESMITNTDTVLDGKYRVEYIEDLWTTVPEKFYKLLPNGKLINQIAEGLLVYIASGSNWNGKYNENHKGEVWILINKNYITNALFDYEDGKETPSNLEPGWRLLGGETPAVNLKWESL